MESWHGTPSGYTNHKCRCDACRLAHRRKAAEYRDANRDRVNAAKRERYQRDPEPILDQNRAWRERNPEKVKAADQVKYQRTKAKRPPRPPKQTAEERKARGRARARERRKEDPESLRARFREWAASPAGRAYFRVKRQERKGAITDAWTADWVAVIAGDPCSYCGGPGGHVEHIDAVRPRDSRWFNLTSACRPCNSSKRTARLLEFLRRRE